MGGCQRAHSGSLGHEADRKPAQPASRGPLFLGAWVRPCPTDRLFHDIPDLLPCPLGHSLIAAIPRWSVGCQCGAEHLANAPQWPSASVAEAVEAEG